MNIAIIGTGYVGLVTGTSFADMGHSVICVDNNQQKLETLKNGNLPIFEPGLDLLFNRNINSGRLTFTDSLEAAIRNSEIIFLSLPTPQDEDGSADLSYVLGVADQIGSYLSKNKHSGYKIIVNKSTVPVGTAKKVAKLIESKGVNNFNVVSNPEFLREGFALEDFLKPDRVVIGADNDYAFRKMSILYEPFVRQGNPIIRMDNESAEVTKYAANSYLAMRISYMNELANFCESVNADIDSVRKGMSTDSRIGKRFLFPGIGYGGSCFPKDVNALIKTASENGHDLKIISAADNVNKNQKEVLVKKVLNHFEGDIKGKHFAVWGLAFKPNTDDMRDAPSINIINRLLEEGATVSAFDPAAAETSKYFFGETIAYENNMYDTLENADALLVLTEWNEFRNPDFSRVEALLKEPVIFDGRNIYSTEKMAEINFTYYSIGRAKVIQKQTTAHEILSEEITA